MSTQITEVSQMNLSRNGNIPWNNATEQSLQDLEETVSFCLQTFLQLQKNSV